MISHKRIYLVTAVLMALAVLVTCALMFCSEAIGVTPVQANTGYATSALDRNAITTVDITVDEAEWADLLQNAQEEAYIPATVTVNGQTYEEVGLRAKGNTSLSQVASDPTTDRYSFKLEFDHYITGQTLDGLDKLALNNVISDATYMKEYLSYDLMTYLGVPTPLYAYCSITVNGEAWGFYLAVECIEESFLERCFATSSGALYKPETVGGGGDAPDGGMGGPGAEGGDADNRQMPPMGDVDGGQIPPTGEAGGGQMPPTEDANGGQNPPTGEAGGQNPPAAGDFPGNGGAPGGMGGGADLVYTDDDPDSYSAIFDNAVTKGLDEADYARTIQALQQLSLGEDVEAYIDVDEVLRYFAANTFLVNLDSYVSSLQHNYYLYEQDGQLTILPWDFNLSFAGFQAGTASAAVNFAIDTPVASGIDLSERPLIGVLLQNETYAAQYHAYLQQIVDDYVGSGYLTALIDAVDSLIAPSVESDPSAFYTYNEYQTAVDALRQFVLLRAQSVEGQLAGSIPATQEGQAADSSRLVDASSLNLSAMGTQGGGMGADLGDGMGFPGGAAGGFPNAQDGEAVLPGGQPDGFSGQADSNSAAGNGADAADDGAGAAGSADSNAGGTGEAPALPGGQQSGQTDGGQDAAESQGDARAFPGGQGTRHFPGNGSSTGDSTASATDWLSLAGWSGAMLLGLAAALCFRRRRLPKNPA